MEMNEYEIQLYSSKRTMDSYLFYLEMINVTHGNTSRKICVILSK